MFNRKNSLSVSSREVSPVSSLTTPNTPPKATQPTQNIGSDPSSFITPPAATGAGAGGAGVSVEAVDASDFKPFEKSLFRELFLELKKYGVDFTKIYPNLDSDEPIQKFIEEFSDKVNDVYHFDFSPDFIPTITTQAKFDGRAYTINNFDNSTETYTVIKDLGTGSFNSTQVVEHEGKQYLLRYSTKQYLTGNDYFKNSFMENLINLIIYLLIRKNQVKLKLIPRVNKIALIKRTSFSGLDFYRVITISELGDKTVLKHLKDNNFDPNEIRKIYLVIFKELQLLQDLLKINFRHGDCKPDNIILTTDGKPMFIDFGFSSFEILPNSVGRKPGELLGRNFRITSVMTDSFSSNPKYNLFSDIYHLISWGEYFLKDYKTKRYPRDPNFELYNPFKNQFPGTLLDNLVEFNNSIKTRGAPAFHKWYWLEMESIPDKYGTKTFDIDELISKNGLTETYVMDQIPRYLKYLLKYLSLKSF